MLERAIAMQAGVILSTPCCHRNLSRKVDCQPLSFVTDHPQLRGKLCEALTDGLRLLYLEMNGYTVSAVELTDPENTPKNTLLRAVRQPHFDPQGKVAAAKREAYRATLAYLMGENAATYLEVL